MHPSFDFLENGPRIRVIIGPHMSQGDSKIRFRDPGQFMYIPDPPLYHGYAIIDTGIKQSYVNSQIAISLGFPSAEAVLDGKSVTRFSLGVHMFNAVDQPPAIYAPTRSAIGSDLPHRYGAILIIGRSLMHSLVVTINSRTNWAVVSRIV